MSLRRYVVMKKIIVLIILIFILHTRFIGLDWGLPYPMHPDERNMANAIQQLTCNNIQSSDCFNPHFFAYGQLPLYIGFILAQLSHVIQGKFNIPIPITFEEATMSLRVISVMSSIATVYVLLLMIDLLTKKKQVAHSSEMNTEKIEKEHLLFLSSLNPFALFMISFLFIFSPVLIQFAHFGTTESLLMFLYCLLVLLSLWLSKKKISITAYMRWTGIILGLAVATKISALPYSVIPAVTIIGYYWKTREKWWLLRMFFTGARLIAYAAIFFAIGSPYNILSFKDFLGTISYESSIGFGDYIPFYTKQFDQTVPILFHSFYIFPYTVGLGIFLLFLGGFLLLPWNKQYHFLRFSTLVIFLPNAYVFAKWSRFIAPMYPLVVLIAVLFLLVIYEKIQSLLQKFQQKQAEMVLPFIAFIIVFILSLPGIAYLSIYGSNDIRFTASKWIVKNLPHNAYILSETANVIDLPIPESGNDLEQYINKGFTYISFNFYDIDTDEVLYQQLQAHIEKADYIFVPSRRVFSNHTCMYPSKTGYYKKGLVFHAERCKYLENKYPKLNNYYKQLFSGELGFTQVAEFTAYPRISFFGKTIYEISDEKAEETWTVFDHPVIRIYKRIN